MCVYSIIMRSNQVHIPYWLGGVDGQLLISVREKKNKTETCISPTPSRTGPCRQLSVDSYVCQHLR